MAVDVNRGVLLCSRDRNRDGRRTVCVPVSPPTVGEFSALPPSPLSLLLRQVGVFALDLLLRRLVASAASPCKLSVVDDCVAIGAVDGRDDDDDDDDSRFFNFRRSVCIHVSLQTTHEAKRPQVAVAIGFQFGERTADNGQGQGHKTKLGGTAAGLRGTGIITDGRVCFLFCLVIFSLFYYCGLLYTNVSGLLWCRARALKFRNWDWDCTVGDVCVWEVCVLLLPLLLLLFPQPGHQIPTVG